MNAKAKAIAVTWAKYFAYTVFVGMATLAKSPIDYTSHDLKQLANGVWFAILPVIVKALNPGQTAFGIGANK